MMTIASSSFGTKSEIQEARTLLSHHQSLDEDEDGDQPDA